jgi:hypothetical protein
MELIDYPHFFLIDDGRQCSMGQHCPGFPRVLYDALLHLSYDGAHGLDRCEVSMTIPFDPTKPWSGSIIGSEADTTVEMMAHATLSHLSDSHLPAIAALPITLLPIQNQENPLW